MRSAIAVVLLLWNLVGVAAFVAQAAVDPDTLAATDPVQAAVLRAMPPWVWIAFGVAVVTGAAGSGALLFRRREALALFLGSLVGELVQFGWTFLATDVWASQGVAGIVFPAVIVGITALSVGWSAKATASAT